MTVIVIDLSMSETDETHSAQFMYFKAMQCDGSLESSSTNMASAAQELSFTSAREMLEQGSRELKRVGAGLSGPAEKIRRAGAEGKWPSNIERDCLRALTDGSLSMEAWSDYSKGSNISA